MRQVALFMVLLAGCTIRTATSTPEHPSRTPSQTLGEVLTEAGTPSPEAPVDAGPGVTLESLVGSYAHLATALPATTVTIRADGTGQVIRAARRGMPPQVLEGRVTVAGDEVTFTADGGGAPPFEAPRLAVRRHEDRVVLLPPDSAAAFDLLPTLALGMVSLREGETPAAVLPEGAEGEEPTNPAAPEGSGAVLPSELAVTVEVPGERGRFLHLDVTTSPHTVLVDGCVTSSATETCPSRTRILNLGPAAWVELNRAWWAATAPADCAAPGDEGTVDRRFTISGGATPLTGALPADLDAAPGHATHPCRPAARIAWWLIEQYGLDEL